jgi:hypothetical protein
VHSGDPLVVRPAGERVAEIDQQRARRALHRVPAAVGTEDFQAGHPIGPQDGDDAAVGVRAHAEVVLLQSHAGIGKCVIVHPEHVDAVVGEALEEARIVAERRTEDLHHRSRDRARGAEPPLDGFLEPGYLGGEDVRGVDVPGDVLLVRVVRCRRADAERIEIE